MKEENKAKVSAKKTQPKKTVKTTSAKKSTTVKKLSTSKKSVSKETKKSVQTESSTLNKELILKTIIIVSYTLIIAILIMGFVESMIRDYTVATKEQEAYIVSSGVIDKTMSVDLSIAKKRFANLRGDYFVYLNYSSSRASITFEREISTLIKEYQLEDKFYYVDIDSLKNDSDIINKINEALGLKEVLINKVPTIYYVNADGILRIENIITRNDDNYITVGDFQNLLDINNYEKIV